MAINAVYLSGWEYNRLLGEDPTEPRNSALPGEVLWNGAAPFWMFEKVYCTKEALDNEREAWGRLGWTTGKIFGELADREGIIDSVDWSSDLDEFTVDELKRQHEELRPARIRQLIEGGDYAELERIKLQILEPLTKQLRCFAAVSPNNLKEWVDPRVDVLTENLAVKTCLGHLEDAAIGSASAETGKASKGGLVVCRRPGSGVSDSDKRRQNEVVSEVEAPLIPDLLAGQNNFAGERGFVPYLQALEPYVDAYRPINDQLAKDWQNNRDALLRLRELAKDHLWPQLHGEWVPELIERGEAFADEFTKLIGKALRASKIGDSLDLPADNAIALVGRAKSTVGGAGIGTALGYVFSEFAGLPAEVVSAGGGGVGSLLTYVVQEARVEAEKKEYGNLALFFQQARKVAKK